MIRVSRLRAIAFFVAVLVALPSFALRLEDLRDFSKKDYKALQKRYEEYETNKQLFSQEQFLYIDNHDLAELIGQLILHPDIKLTDTQLLMDFAQTIKDSGYTLATLEVRIVRYIDREIIAFDALNLAIDRERTHDWRLAQLRKVKMENNTFVRAIDRTDLDTDEKEKVIWVYASCVAPYADYAQRDYLKPSMCQNNNEFPMPRHKENKHMVRTRPSSHRDAYSEAYDLFIAEVKDVADRNGLNAFEKIKMSKCVAEQALEFFAPSRNPIRAISKLIDMHTKSPEEAFFMHSGVCANFSGIAYNVAREIGFDGRVYLAKKGVHVYVEFEEAGSWYHAHPFNSQGKCDITRF